MRRTQTSDPARQFLESALAAELEIRRRKERADEIEGRVKRVTAQLSAQPRGGGKDQQEMLAVLADARTRELEAVREAEEQRQKVEAFIARIPSPVQREVLALRYLSFCGWKTVQKKLQAVGLYYSERQITRHHGAALNEARRLYAQESLDRSEGEGRAEEPGRQPESEGKRPGRACKAERDNEARRLWASDHPEETHDEVCT